MSGSRQLALLIVALVFAGVCASLGVWQLGRRGERAAADRARAQRLALPPLDWSGAGPPPADTAGLVWRRARVSGRFDPAREVILRSRASGGRPGVEVLTPLRGAGPQGAAIMVLRGWLPAVDALRAELSSGWSRTPADTAVTVVEGVLLPSRAGRGGPPVWVESDGQRHLALAGIDLAPIAEHLPYPLLPHVLRASDPGSGETALEAAGTWDTGAGPHLSYALQWFSFAAITLVGTGIVLRKERAA